MLLVFGLFRGLEGFGYIQALGGFGGFECLDF